MNKAEFFDQSHDDDWASRDYRDDQHLDDKEGVLRVFRKYLKPSGVLVIARLQGSRILNKMHRKAGGVVKEDRIPPFHEVIKLFDKTGFQFDFFKDQDDGYYLLARCKKQ